MEEKEIKGDKPNFRGCLSAAAWFNRDKNGKSYLSVVIGNRITLFPNKEEPEGKEIEDIFE